MSRARAKIAGALVAVAAARSLSACGSDVDVGGGDDAGAADDAFVPDAALPDGAEPPRAPCDPCADATECRRDTTCATLDGGNTYCLVLCPTGSECTSPDECQSIAAAEENATMACVPRGGSCTPAPPPSSDGGPLLRCGDLVAPSVAASCRSCNPSSSTCQPNGCYGGWWCDTYDHRCHRPPESC